MIMDLHRYSKLMQKVINMKNLKRITYLLLFILVIRRVYIVINDDSCRALFYEVSNNPIECTMKNYLTNDIDQCISQMPVRLAFVNIYDLFREFSRQTTLAKSSSTNILNQMNTNHSFKIIQRNFEMCFYNFGTRRVFTSDNAYNINTVCEDFSPTHVFISLTSNFDLKPSNITFYQDRFEQLSELMNATLKIPVFWILQDPPAGSGDRSSWETLAILEYNEKVMKRFSPLPNVYIIRLTQPTEGETNDTDDLCSKDNEKCSVANLAINRHVSSTLSKKIVQRFWNFRCNRHTHTDKRSCCRDPNPITKTQWRCFILIGICVCITIVMFIYDQALKGLRKCLKFKNILPESTLHRENALLRHIKEFFENLFPSISFEEFYEMITALSQFGIILVFFYICDRTTLFYNKPFKFSWNRLAIPLTFFAFVGILSIRKSKRVGILHVDITREWKGFMQIYILVYHYICGYTVLSTYLWARISVSSYMFLSGFGHFIYFWRRPVSQISFTDLRSFIQSVWPLINRYLEVMFRLNFFPLSVYYIMGGDFLLYYFVPLISHWFSVMYLLMCIWPRVSSHITKSLAQDIPVDSAQQSRTTNPSNSKASVSLIKPSGWAFLIMFLKISLLATLHLTISLSKSIFHWIFQTPFARYILRLDLVIANIFMLALSVDQHAENIWYHRWSLDRFSAIYGLCFGLILEWLYSIGLLSDNNESTNQPGTDVSRFMVDSPPTVKSTRAVAYYRCLRRNAIKFALTLFGLIILWITFRLTITAKDQAKSLQIHAIFCFIPILAYIFVRSSFTWLRGYYSAHFAWVGDMALELYIAQSHIWLSENGTKNLVLLPEFPLLNIVLTTLAFGLLSDEIHQLTGRLQKYLVPKTPVGLLWAFFCVYGLLLFLNAYN